MPEGAEEKSRIGRFLSALGKPFRRSSTPQPMMPLWKSGIQEPVLVQGVTIPALYATVQESIILRTTINTLAQEIFRRGYYWEKEFYRKCTECEEEYQHDVLKCELCGSETEEPDVDQLLYPKWLFKQRNDQDQSFIDVMREVEWDLDIVDDAFLVLEKEYFIDEKSGDVEFYRVKSLARSDPTFMRLVADKRGARGGRWLICMRAGCRDKTYPHTEEYEFCEKCELPLQDVHYVNSAGAGKTQYYLEGEVIHISKYNPSKLYGRSPVATMWRQAMTLTAMDNYMYLAYSKRRIPRGILAITTDNIQSTAAFWKGAEEKMERDPHYIPKVGVESATGRGKVEFVRFMDSLDEMQYAQVRDEIRTRIAAFYGVSNIFMMDTGKGGGLNNEGMQILVTNRAVEFGQKIYTRDLFPRIMNEMGVTDWKVTLYPNEEEDDVTRLRRDEMEVNVAQRMMQLGFQPVLKEDAARDIRFIYKKPEEQAGAAPPGAPAPGGAPPMMGGGMPPPMPMGGMPPGGMPMGARPPGGMPPGGMPPGGMPPGGMPMGGGMPPGGMPIRTGQPMAGLGESQGLRDRGPSPVEEVQGLTGHPTGGKKKQRGSEKSAVESALDAVAEAHAGVNGKQKESGFKR